MKSDTEPIAFHCGPSPSQNAFLSRLEARGHGGKGQSPPNGKGFDD